MFFKNTFIKLYIFILLTKGFKPFLSFSLRISTFFQQVAAETAGSSVEIDDGSVADIEEGSATEIEDGSTAEVNKGSKTEGPEALTSRVTPTIVPLVS